MELVYKVDGIDCANCAAKLERAIAKLSCVNSATLTFMTGRLVVDAADESAEKEILAVIAKREPDATVKRI
ncbi:MAG: cation transporter [Clostridia bacterium]|nr:cation transporter [Clostridia bacterium]